MVYFDLTFEYILFGCFCISMPLYLLVLVTLVRTPKSDVILGSSFFLIVLSTGIADVIAAFLTYFCVKFRLWGLAFDFYATIHPVLKYELLLGFATNFAQSIGTLLIALNRFTAIAMPLRHSTIWLPERVRLYIIAQWTIAVVVMIPGAFMEFCDMTFNKVPDDGVAVVNGVNYTGLETAVFYQSSVAFVWAVGAILTLFVYLTLFGMLRVRRLQQERQSSLGEIISATPLHEYRLLTYGIIMTLIQVG
uniref:G-protein coupled receptors family 1 profile domain-containing protein n=1 Tax=Plectus sambesii TaxID=2011161 RepID=A0A914WDW4_9BILA